MVKCSSGHLIMMAAPYGLSRGAVIGRVQSVPFYQLRVHWRACVTRASLLSTEQGLNSEQPERQLKIPSIQEKTVDAFRSYPWERLCWRFLGRASDLTWTATKWLAIPVFALSIISELIYTLSIRKDICIPLGILCGVLFAKVIGNASIDVMKELQQDGRTAWPLMLLGLFFLLLKLPGPYYPSWAAAFIPHMANAGLVKTALLFRDSQRLAL